jgi:hypothetical protein
MIEGAMLSEDEIEGKDVERISASEEELGDASRWRWFVGIAI